MQVLKINPLQFRSMNLWKPSVTVASLIEQDGKFLLVEELTTDGLRLNQPAGHLEQGETPVLGAIREALEETAYEVELNALLGIYLSRYRSTRTGEDITYLRLAFVGQVVAHDPNRTLDEGIVRALWMTPQEICDSQAQHRSPLVWRCMQDYLSGRRYSLDSVFCHDTVISGV